MLYLSLFVFFGAVAGVAGSFFSVGVIEYYFPEYREEEVSVSAKKNYFWITTVSALAWGLIYYMRPELSWWGIFPALSFTALISLSVIDFEFMAVPDSLNFAALLFALIQPDFMGAAVNAAIVFVGFYLFVKGFSFLLNRESMGSADLIVGATMASLLGIGGFFAALFLGAVFSLVAMAVKRSRMEPFVPYLALATFLCFIFIDDTNALISELFIAPFSR